MASLSSLLVFYVAALALIVSPGPDMLLIIARGIGQGRRAALLTAAGTTLVAASLQLPLLALGIASLVTTSAILFAMLKWAGAAYMVWIGMRCCWHAGRRALAPPSSPPVSDWSALRSGAISNLTNPKPMLFLLAFLPQFVDQEASYSPAVQLLVLGALLKGTSFVLMTLVAVAAGSIGDFVARNPTLLVWQERFTGLVMIGLGFRLAIDGGTPLRS